MRVISAVLVASLAASTNLVAQSDPAKVTAYLKSLPTVAPPTFDEPKRESLATSGIVCSDHPQESPSNRNNYLWQFRGAPTILDTYTNTRAFYGCANWHDAVASVWMMMETLKLDPKITLNTSIKDIATTHFKKSNMDGELAFLSGARPAGAAGGATAAAAPAGGGGGEGGGAAANFERPYGYAWLLKLYGEVKSGTSSDDHKMTLALAPLARFTSERMVFYLYDLKLPTRSGVESNTAWMMTLTLDGAILADNETLKTAIHDNAIRLFSKDKNCATGFEPQNNDLISSCLSVAALMSRVMAPTDYVKWLDSYLPPVYSDAFQVYAKPVDISHTNTSGPDAQVQTAAQARLIGLQFQRAASMLTISYALPKEDPRVAVLRNLASQNAKWAYDKFGISGYEGEHFLGTYALLYEVAAKGPAPTKAPEKKKKPDADGGDSNDGIN